MSLIPHITVPEGMSPINAFHALWKEATLAPVLKRNAELAEYHAKEVESAEKIVALFKLINANSRTGRISFEYEGGRALLSTFTCFPRLNVTRYDQLHGRGAAARALDNYAKLPASEQIDPENRYTFAILTRRDLDL